MILRKYFLILLTLTIFGVSGALPSALPGAFAAGEASVLDLDRFQLEAQAELHKLFPDERMDFQGATVLFRDGAANLGAPVLEDLASIVYVLPLREGALPSKTFRLGYRLWLNGKIDMPFVEYPVYADPEDSGIRFRSAESGSAQLQSFATKADAQNLIASLRKIVPEGEYTYAITENRLSFRVAPAFAVKVLGALQASALVRRASMDVESYPNPAEIDYPERITKRGKIDLDDYRTVTDRLKKRGMPFKSSTQVPERLR